MIKACKVIQDFVYIKKKYYKIEVKTRLKKE